jgi:hypothetical protein
LTAAAHPWQERALLHLPLQLPILHWQCAP